MPGTGKSARGKVVLNGQRRSTGGNLAIDVMDRYGQKDKSNFDVPIPKPNTDLGFRGIRHIVQVDSLRNPSRN